MIQAQPFGGFFSTLFSSVIHIILYWYLCMKFMWRLLLVLFKASRLLPFAYDNVCIYKIPLLYGIIWLLVLLLLCFYFDCFRIICVSSQRAKKGINNICICLSNCKLMRSFNRIPCNVCVYFMDFIAISESYLSYRASHWFNNQISLLSVFHLFLIQKKRAMTQIP